MLLEEDLRDIFIISFVFMYRHGHVRGIYDYKGSRTFLDEIGISGIAKNCLVVIVGGEIASRITRTHQIVQACRSQRPHQQCMFDVFLEKFALKGTIKQPIAMQRIVRSGKASARHRRDNVHLIGE